MPTTKFTEDTARNAFITEEIANVIRQQNPTFQENLNVSSALSEGKWKIRFSLGPILDGTGKFDERQDYQLEQLEFPLDTPIDATEEIIAAMKKRLHQYVTDDIL